MKKDIRLHYTLFLLFLVVLSISSAQNSGPNYDKLEWNEPSFDFQETSRDSLVLWQERVVLHIANEHMGNNNLLFFKGYLLSGVQKNRRGLSDVLIVELLDLRGAVIKRQFHKVTNGMVDGNLEFPKNIEPGKYYLRAYTRWMQNYDEVIYAKMPTWLGDLSNEAFDNANNSNALIFPEGGCLLNGYENRVVIKVPLNEGKKDGKVGAILDDQNNTVAEVTSYLGIGTSLFKPIKGRKYRLVLENGTVYPIPKAQDQGYLLHINNLDENNAKIRVTASSEVLGTEVTLVGTTGRIRYFENQLDFKDGNILDVDLSKRNIPFGIFTLKLVDDVGTELARRPIWIDGERLHIDIEPISSDSDESAYKIKVTDKTNSPVTTQLALSVKKKSLNNKFLFDDYPIEHSNLFIYSEMIGENTIMTDRKNLFHRDLIVLASNISTGIKTFDSSSLENDIRFSVQKGLELAGFAYDLGGKLLINTKIQIIAQSEDGIWFKESETDVNGLLTLHDIQINGTSKLIFRTKGAEVKSRLVKLRPINQGIKTGSRSSNKITKKETRNPIYEPTLWKTNRELKNMNESETWEFADSTRLIELEEVEVIEKIQEIKKGRPSIYGISAPKARIKYQDPERPKSFAQLLYGMPGITVSGSEDSASFAINRASGSVLWVVDGFPLPKVDSGTLLGSAATNSTASLLEIGIASTDIERIEVLIGAEASIYGVRGAGGVVLVYTRTGDELEYISRNEGQLVLKGYERNLEFDTYQQNLSKTARENSSLLYWNPKLETDENGEAIFRIPTASQETVIQIEASTITADGKIGSLSADF